MIKIGKKGKIIKGEELGNYILIQDDKENSGGYLILLKDETLDRGFDYWVENYEMLEKFFDQSQWVVDWLKD